VFKTEQFSAKHPKRFKPFGMIQIAHDRHIERSTFKVETFLAAMDGGKKVLNFRKTKGYSHRPVGPMWLLFSGSKAKVCVNI
jgi:hypothetical protein